MEVSQMGYCTATAPQTVREETQDRVQIVPTTLGFFWSVCFCLVSVQMWLWVCIMHRKHHWDSSWHIYVIWKSVLLWDWMGETQPSTYIQITASSPNAAYWNTDELFTYLNKTSLKVVVQDVKSSGSLPSCPSWVPHNTGSWKWTKNECPKKN